MRDELVRAIMPELTVLLQHLVATAVERATQPLLRRQQELENALKDLRSAQPIQKPPTDSTVTPAKTPVARDLLPSNERSSPVYSNLREVSSAPAPAVVATRDARPVIPLRVQSPIADAHAAFQSDDLPPELRGSHRRKVVLWTFVLGIVSLLLLAIGLSISSNL